MSELSLTKLLTALILFGLLSAAVPAQDCAVPTLIPNPKSSNIFSPEQEMVLGDLTYQRLAGDMRFVRDPQLLAYVNQIGERLISHLPPTGLKFQFFIIDIPAANAFDVPGGYIFISRKLISFANNEDELAGVMAHELGHAVVRHGATDFSELLKKILNVTQLGGRKDIADKYNLLIERSRTKNISKSSEGSEQQLQADRVGIFALIAAGYDPNAFASFFDRLVETKGKTGNWFSDIFGKPKPEQKRLREMIKLSEQLPPACREAHKARPSEEFLKWQADVVSFHEVTNKEDLRALLWKKELRPKLRSDISHFAFSPDGTYLLAQDDFAITILQREPLRVAFQIPALNAHEASFTPDGKFVVFGTENLRYEKWSLAEKRPSQVRELVVRGECLEHAFSPNGKYLACFDYGLNLAVLDTETGKKIFEKKEFYRLSFFELLTWLSAQARAARSQDDQKTRFFNIEFSPDSQFLAVARSNKSRFRVRVNGMYAAGSEDTSLVVDLASLKPVKTSGDWKKVTSRPFIFLDSTRILGMASGNPEDSGIFSFPEGKRLAKFVFGGKELRRTANPNYVIVKPLKNSRMGVFDVSRSTIISASNRLDADLWNNKLIYETTSGEVLVSEITFNETTKALQTKPIDTIDIPVASIGNLSAVDLSDNLQWLAASTKTRGALWNLGSGERKLFIRGFKSALVANDGGALGDFPADASVNHSLALLNPNANEAKPIREIPETGAAQYGNFLLLRQSLKAPSMSDKENADEGIEFSADEGSLTHEVRFELRNVVSDKVVWSRDYPKDAPSFFFDAVSGRLILYWKLGSEAGKAMLKESPDLGAKAKELGNKDDDYLMEIVDGFAAKTVGRLLMETGKGSFSFQDGFSEGNWLMLRDYENRMLVYSIADGNLRQRFFGANARINPARNQIVVENYPGELTFYDLESGDNQAHLSISSAAAFIKYSLDGKRLFVLSGDQTAYAFDMDKLTVASSANR